MHCLSIRVDRQKHRWHVARSFHNSCKRQYLPIGRESRRCLSHEIKHKSSEWILCKIIHYLVANGNVYGLVTSGAQKGSLKYI
ncbi:hypothetical protein AHAS_Ahas14G0072100 [Arachis hypogaea]